MNPKTVLLPLLVLSLVFLSGCTSPIIPELPSEDYNVKVYYLYHYDTDFNPDYKQVLLANINEASDIRQTYDNTRFEPDIEAVKIDSVTFGDGESIQRWVAGPYNPDFNSIFCELGRKTNLDTEWYQYDRTWFVFGGMNSGAFYIPRSVSVFSWDFAKTYPPIFVYEHLRSFGCESYDDHPRDLNCFMDNTDLPILNETSLCDCYGLAYNETYYKKTNLIILKGVC